MAQFKNERIRVAVLGAGGLGKAACRIIGMKQELQLCAICDSQGVVLSGEGLEAEKLASFSGDLVSGYRARLGAIGFPRLPSASLGFPRLPSASPRGERREASGFAARRASAERPAASPLGEQAKPLEQSAGGYSENQTDHLSTLEIDPSTRTTAFGRGFVLRQAQDSSRARRNRAEGLAQDSVVRRTSFAHHGTERSRSTAPRTMPVGLHDAFHCDDPIEALIERSESFDAVLIALPNLPNEFIPGVVERFTRAKRSLAFVDVLKRTTAVRAMFALDDRVKQANAIVMTGCGATPGILAAASVLAAQSFIQIERVDIWWGVGIANWETYKATIREDIAHLPNYDLERARAMSDEEIEALLEKTNGLLTLRHMEHADDLLLERVGVVEALNQVEVGGVMDTRHPQKPVSTTMTLTGITFDGKRSSHRFILGDETTMAANVIGPALGYLKRALWLKAHGITGVFGCTEFLPMVVK